MGDLTGARPKPMLEVNGRPMLAYVVERLASAGCAPALIVTGYHAEAIESYFAPHSLRPAFIRQSPIDGTGSAALLARDFAAADPFLLTFGDILADAVTYTGIVAAFEAEPRVEAVLAARHVDDPHQGAAVYVERDCITRIVEKPPKGTSATPWNSAGIYVFGPSIFDELARVPLSPRGEYELTSAVSQLIDRGARLRMFPVEGRWRDVGRPEDLQALQD